MEEAREPTFSLRIDGVRHLCRMEDGRPSSIVDAETGLPPTWRDRDGGEQPLDDNAFFALVAAGRVRVEPVPSLAGLPSKSWRAPADGSKDRHLWPAEVRRAISEAADAAGVPFGDKANARFVAGIWTEDLQKTFGRAPSGRTVRLWRAALLAEAGKSGLQQPSRLPSLVEHLLEANVARCASSDSSIVVGFVRLASELEAVNRGVHPLHPRPDAPYRCPSRTTFSRRVKRWRTHSAARRSCRMRRQDHPERTTRRRRNAVQDADRMESEARPDGGSAGQTRDQILRKGA